MILYAPNINSGGGLVLLNTLIEDEVFGKVSILFIDARCPIKNEFDNIEIIRIRPSIFARLKAELLLKNKTSKKNNEDLICFGNLPPLLKHTNKTYVFLQNAYLLRNVPLPRKLKLKIRTIYERFILYCFSNNVDEFIVQTAWMKKSLEKFCDASISIKPILPNFPPLFEDRKLDRKFDLLAITGPEEHKNSHLIQKIFNKVSRVINICVIGDIDLEISNTNCNCTHIRTASREELFELYNTSSSILILSSFESFCLPLYEANYFKLKIIAPKLPYILDSKLVFEEIKLNELKQIIDKINKLEK